jgi:serine/threonine protein kinase
VTTEVKRSQYRTLGLVGQGQFGRVYCAGHRRTGQLVALKELDQRFPTHKFLRELRFLLSLQHPNIVTCQALEHFANRRYLVMDYCAGGTLRSLMEANGQLHPTLGLQIVMDVLRGIEHAHGHNIIHCDIKPENILLDVRPEGWTARISDFGISQLSQDLKHEGSGITGSPAYMAPERFYGQYSMSSDLYAVGVMLFELLTGYRPFSGTPGDLMSAHMNQKVRIPGSVGAPLQTILATALQKLQARRFRSATQMLMAVEAAARNDLNTINQPLLQPIAIAPLLPLKVVREERFDKIIERLALDHTTPDLERLYRVGGQQIGAQVYPQGQLARPQAGAEFDVLPVPEPIQNFMVRPQGCFAVTARSLYLLPLERVQSASYLVADGSLPGLKRLNPLVKPQLVTQFDKPFCMTIDPKGRWMATATREVGTTPSVLNIRQLPQLNRLHTPISCRSPHLLDLHALDSRHLALLFKIPQQEIPEEMTATAATSLQVFTRRGHPVANLLLPVSLTQVVLCPQPYRLVATEPQHPSAILIIDLKPLKLQRIAVEIEPRLIAATAWGLILVDGTGQILVLDRYGQALGRCIGPTDPTVIVPFDDYGLLMGTWQAGQSRLYTLDLRALVADQVKSPQGKLQ